VGNDPYGIGFASSADIDPNQVAVVSLNVNGVTQTWSRKSVLNSTTATGALGANAWALVRGISVVSTPNTAAWGTWSGPTPGSTQAATDFLAYLAGTFKGSTILNTAYFPALGAIADYPVGANSTNGTAVFSTWTN
jgi:hypothetical protein